MSRDHTEPEAIHHWVWKQRARAIRSRNNTEGSSQHKAMLGGKIKAYTELLCLIEDRYNVPRKPTTT